MEESWKYPSVVILLILSYGFVVWYRSFLGPDTFTEYFLGVSSIGFGVMAIFLLSIFIGVQEYKLRTYQLVFFNSIIVFIVSLYLLVVLDIKKPNITNVFALGGIVSAMLFIVRFLSEETRVFRLWEKLKSIFGKDVLGGYESVKGLRNINVSIEATLYSILIFGLLEFVLNLQPGQLQISIYEMYGTKIVYLVFAVSVVTGIVFGFIEKILLRDSKVKFI